MYYRLAIMLLILPAFATADFFCNPSSDYHKERTACLFDELLELKNEMDNVLQGLLKDSADDENLKTEIKKSQQSWVTYKDNEMNAMFTCPKEDVNCYGTGYGDGYARYETVLVKQRINVLQTYNKKGLGYGWFAAEPFYKPVKDERKK